jgi:hypothetical protein
LPLHLGFLEGEAEVLAEPSVELAAAREPAVEPPIASPSELADEKARETAGQDVPPTVVRLAEEELAVQEWAKRVALLARLSTSTAFACPCSSEA